MFKKIDDEFGGFMMFGTMLFDLFVFALIGSAWS